MSAKTREEASRHRFFRTMVVMGSSLAVGCGGATSSDEDTLSSSPTGSGDSGTTGGSSGTDGVSSGSGGAVSETGGTGSTPSTGGTGSGGVFGAGGVTAGGGSPGTGGILIGAGGSPENGPVVPGPFSCPPAQWDCGMNPPQCDGSGTGYALPTDCSCDSRRPLAADACQPNETFVCLLGTSTADGRVLSEPVPFECVCVPQSSYCETTCDVAYPTPGGGLTCSTSPDGRDILCGCAIVVLL